MNTKDDSLKRLHDGLKSLLDALGAKYFSKPDNCFLPTLDELNRLTDNIIALGKAIGKKRFASTDIWGVIKAIDRRYRKLRLIARLDKLVNKLVALPQGPLTRIKKQLETQPDNAALKELAGLVEDTSYSRDYTNTNWEKLYRTILPFTTKRFRSLAKTLFDDRIFENQERFQSFGEEFGWAAFTDVQRQHLLWKRNFEAAFSPVAAWVYILQNPGYDTKIRAAFHGTIATPEEFEKDHKRSLAARRQRKHRKKHIQVP